MGTIQIDRTWLIQGLTPYLILEKLTSQWKKWILLHRRIKCDRSAVTAQDWFLCSQRRTYVHQSSSRSVRQPSRFSTFSQRKKHIGFSRYEDSKKSGGLGARRLAEEAAQISLEFYQTANGAQCAASPVPSEFLTKTINFKDGPEGFGTEESKDEELSPTERVDATKVSGGKCHGMKWTQETLEIVKLRAISSTGEIIKVNTVARSM